jgi:hypothetical protein
LAELWPSGPIELPHTLTIDGVELTLPEIPTPKLMFLVATQAWWEVLPNAVDPAQVAPLVERVFDDEDPFDLENFCEPALVVLGRLAGTHPRKGGGTGWWPAVRLCGSALAEWPLFAAWCVQHGTDIVHAPLWKATSAIYAWLREDRDPKDLAKFEQQVWAPPPYTRSTTPDQLPDHVRAEEAALALAALREALPGEERVPEWGTRAPTTSPK